MATTTACAPKLAADGADQCGVGQGSGVDAYLVRAGLKHLFGILRRLDASAHAKGHKQLARCAPHRIEQGLAALVRRRNVEQNDFIGAFARVARSLRRWIARVDEVDKLHALDHAAGVHVEAGDDALGQHSYLFTTWRATRSLSSVC